VPSSGMVQFRMPLADRYVIEHRDDLESKEVIAFRLGIAQPKGSRQFPR
jgi:hypothetical protein